MRGTVFLVTVGLLCFVLASSAAVAADAQSLEIVEARNGEVTLVCETAACTTSFRIASYLPKGLEARVTGASLTNDRGAPTPIRFLPDTVALAAYGTAMVNVVVTLPDPGVYTGTLAIIVDDAVATKALLTVKRELRPATVELLGLSTVAISTDTGQAEIRFDLREVGGRATQVPVPTLAALVRGDRRLQVIPTQASVKKDGQEPKNGTIALTEYQTVPLTLELTGLTEPGTYTVTIRLSPPGAKAVEATTTVLARKGEWIAALCILVGVIVGSILRFYRDHLRPKLLARERAVKLGRLILSETPADLDADEQAVHQKLLAEVAEATDAVSSKKTSEIANDLDALDAKRRLFDAWRRERRRLRTLPARLWDKAVDDAQGAVQSAQTLLEGPATTEAITKSLEALEAIANAVLSAACKRLLELFADLKAQLNLDADEIANLPKHLEEIDRAIAAVSEAERSGDSRKLGAPYRIYDDIRRAYVAALVHALRAALDTGPPRELTDTLDPQAWRDLRKRVEEALRGVAGASPELAAELYQAASHRYLGGLADALAEEVGKTLRIVRERLDNDPEYKKNHADVLEGVTALRDEARKLASTARTGDVRAARGGIEMAIANLDEIRQTLVVRRTTGGPGGRGQALRTIRTAGGAAPTAPLPRDTRSTPALRALEELRLRFRLRNLSWGIWLADAALFVGAATIAVVWGTSALWSPSLTWGSGADIITAALWGLGINSVAGAGFQGVSALRGALGGTA